MALTIGSSGGVRILYNDCTKHTYNQFPVRRHALLPFSSRTLHVASAGKKLTPRTGRFDSKNRRSSITTKDQEDDQEKQAVQIEDTATNFESVGVGVDGNGAAFDLSSLPGLKPDFWEGPQWDAFGFFVQYLWAFGIVFALIACGIAVATYNEGATDFKKTPVYQESIQSRELLEEPEISDSDVFESNPTEVAPSLE